MNTNPIQPIPLPPSSLTTAPSPSDLAAPTGGTSAGDVQLKTTAADLVTGISTLAESNHTITYKFYAGIAAGIVASTTRTVTLTLTDP